MMNSALSQLPGQISIFAPYNLTDALLVAFRRKGLSRMTDSIFVSLLCGRSMCAL